eukprot:c29418_g1_i1 orf=127-285(+)
MAEKLVLVYRMPKNMNEMLKERFLLQEAMRQLNKNMEKLKKKTKEIQEKENF